MRVRMKKLMAGPGGVAAPGQIIDVSPRQAQQLVSGGAAEYVDGFETATVAPKETSTWPKHVGGGWYELPSGERIRGKDAALERMAET